MFSLLFFFFLVCHQTCELSNKTCSSYSQCCHKECLGGCSGSLSSECIACRHVVFEGKCQLHCPPGTYKVILFKVLTNRLCIIILKVTCLHVTLYFDDFKIHDFLLGYIFIKYFTIRNFFHVVSMIFSFSLFSLFSFS